MDIKLCDLVAAADETHKLLLCDAQSSIGHHVEQTDMKLANVLVNRLIEL
jgi:hypothetical protein